MKVILNNLTEKLPFNDSLTISELLEYKKFSFKMLVIKINGVLIKKDKYNTAYIKDGDIVDVIHLISGG